MNNLAFELGFDHYRYGFPLDVGLFMDKFRQDVQQGFEAAQIQQVTRKRADMYEKKLLGIRKRALNKGLKVTITCDDLRQALAETKGKCPVTKILFTYAEKVDTDWSVDRINNDWGYIPDNIVIV